jgi:uncharacterized Fe-S center protein
MGKRPKVYFFTDEGKLTDALDLLGIADFKGKRVPVKLHMGEPGNKYFISPSLVKLAVRKLKETGAEPFLFDTTVAYPGPRSTKRGYEEAARRHGFGDDEMGCRVVIGDRGVKVAESGYSFEVAREIYKSSHVVVLSHVKGHIGSGFGGAVKNLGMGGVTKETKAAIHVMSSPVFFEGECDLCGDCAEACPFGALTVKSAWEHRKAACQGCGVCVSACTKGALVYKEMDLQKGLALSAKACIAGKRVVYINAMVSISRDCDCDPNARPVICPDVGYLVSEEPAAIDQASLDLVHEVKPEVFEKATGIDPSKQVRYAQELGFIVSYELVGL